MRTPAKGALRDAYTTLTASADRGACVTLTAKLVWHKYTLSQIEVDELWGFIGKKKHATAKDIVTGIGDVWTFVALDVQTNPRAANC